MSVKITKTREHTWFKKPWSWVHRHPRRITERSNSPLASSIRIILTPPTNNVRSLVFYISHNRTGHVVLFYLRAFWWLECSRFQIFAVTMRAQSVRAAQIWSNVKSVPLATIGESTSLESQAVWKNIFLFFSNNIIYSTKSTFDHWYLTFNYYGRTVRSLLIFEKHNKLLNTFSIVRLHIELSIVNS